LPLGATPKGLTTAGVCPEGSLEMAPAANISERAEVTNSACAKAEDEFLATFSAGAPLIYLSS
jgi:hypothetical protein